MCGRWTVECRGPPSPTGCFSTNIVATSTRLREGRRYANRVDGRGAKVLNAHSPHNKGKFSQAHQKSSSLMYQDPRPRQSSFLPQDCIRPSPMARSALETGLDADNHPRNMGCHPSGIRMNHFQLRLSSLRHCFPGVGIQIYGLCSIEKVFLLQCMAMRQKLHTGNALRYPGNRTQARLADKYCCRLGTVKAKVAV